MYRKCFEKIEGTPPGFLQMHKVFKVMGYVVMFTFILYLIAALIFSAGYYSAPIFFTIQRI